MNIPNFRLTSLAHGGGCGCKLSPSVLQQLLTSQPASLQFERLLVGIETGDDAAVYKLDDGTCVIATTDFFMPMVDDPYEFGRIAATNAISDVYAMGGTPIMALAILGIPLGKLPPEMAAKILAGGSAVCAAAGIPVAGGHSIDSPEPIYGLAVIGTCKVEDIRRNADAQIGDAVILTKALGVGIYAAAFKKGALSAGAYADMIASMTLLNRVGTKLAKDTAVHAMTDVTGFGLFGHAMEMARGSHASIVLKMANIPLLPEAPELVRQGFFTGASVRNWESYGDGIKLGPVFPDWQRHLFTDPQTSGGLLIACNAADAEAIARRIVDDGYPFTRIIGHVERGKPSVTVLD